MTEEQLARMRLPGFYDAEEATGESGAAPIVGGESSSVTKKSGNGDLSIMDCFNLFRIPEKLEESDMWYCRNCKNHVRAIKTMELWSVPDVLVIHLKRFMFNSYRRDKVELAVDFPLDSLDLSEHVKGDLPAGGAVYDCVAVSNHMGNLGGGHYVAAARNCNDGKWYKFNDSYTSVIDPSDVTSRDGLASAYLLFYVRRDSKSGTSGGI